MESNFILWAKLNGKKVYTNQDRSFSFTEDILDQVCIVLKRGYPVNVDIGESFVISYTKLSAPTGTSTFKGVHKVYTELNLLN